MSPLIVPPSGVAILAKVYDTGSASIPEIATDTRLSPGQIRNDLAYLKDRGLAELDQDGLTVRITNKGLHVFPALAKSRQPFTDMVFSPDLEGAAKEKNMEGVQFFMHEWKTAKEEDVDRALDKALDQLAD